MRQLTFLRPGRLEWRDVPAPRLQGPKEALVRPISVARWDLDRAILFGEAQWQIFREYRFPVTLDPDTSVFRDAHAMSGRKLLDMLEQGAGSWNCRKCKQKLQVFEIDIPLNPRQCQKRFDLRSESTLIMTGANCVLHDRGKIA